MKENKISEEYLEVIWTLLEQRKDTHGQLGTADLERFFGAAYSQKVLDQLVSSELIRYQGDRVGFTESGWRKSRQLIRAHRLAERLLYDVLGIEDYEVGACEFEHIIDTNLIDGICTLLGHPRRCPDGLPIPEGNCCRNRDTALSNTTVSVIGMRPGDSGRIAAVNADDDTRLHILENLLIRPGSSLRIHQVSPTIVVECGGSLTALDDDLAAEIHVWPTLQTDTGTEDAYRDTRDQGYSRRDDEHHPRGRRKKRGWRRL